MCDLAGFVERLLPIEREYFLWLNQQRSDFLDTFMYVFSDKATWLLISIVLFLTIIYKLKLKEVILLLFCAFLLGMLCDRLPAELIKPFFARLRPTHHPDYKDIVDIVRNTRGGQFGFISIHVANGFGIAVLTSLLFRYKPYTFVVFLWAFITAYSRVYLGMHFISDVIGGIIWGTFAGLLVYCFYQLFRYKVFKIPSDELMKPILTQQKAQVLIGMFFLTLIYVIIAGFFPQII